VLTQRSVAWGQLSCAPLALMVPWCLLLSEELVAFSYCVDPQHKTFSSFARLSEDEEVQDGSVREEAVPCLSVCSPALWALADPARGSAGVPAAVPIASSCLRAAVPGGEARSLPQNHRMVGVGRDLCGSPSPTPVPKQGHL